MKVSKAIREIFNEAFIRNELLSHDPSQCNKPLKSRWLGLGTKTEYGPAIDAGLMQFVHTPQKRCNGWLNLTDEGVELFNTLFPSQKGELIEHSSTT